MTMNNPPSWEIDLKLLKDSYQNELLEYIDACAEPKAVYWEQRLMTPVSLIIGHSILKAHGVSNSFVLDGNTNSYSPPECKAVIFILTSKVNVVDWTQSFLLRDAKLNNFSKEYHIIAIPAFTYVCKTFLADKGVLKKFTSIREFPLTVLPIDNDVLSLEDPDCFADYSIAHKQQTIYRFAQGLMRFQSVFGLFPRIRSKGDKAKEVIRILTCMRNNACSDVLLSDKGGEKSKHRSSFDEIDSQSDMLIVIDRSMDPLTPLLCQLTYEGLISTKWGIHFGVCQQDHDGGQSKRIPLNFSDELFAELRDLNFESVGPILSRRTTEVAKVVNESKSAKQLTDLRRVVNQIPQIHTLQKSLEIHTSITESLRTFVSADNFMLSFMTQQDLLNGYETDKAHPYIEDCILQGAPLEEVLRLVCIQSFCNGGLKQRLLDYYKREILQVYGFENMFTLDNLDRVGLLYNSSIFTNDSRSVINQTFIQKTTTNQHQPLSGLAVRRLVTTISNLFSSGTLKKNLRLLVPPAALTANSSELTDVDPLISQLYVGYIPLLVRLVQYLSIGRPVRTVTTITSGQLTSTSGGGHPASPQTYPASSATLTAMMTTGRRLVTGLLTTEETTHAARAPSPQQQPPMPSLNRRSSQSSTTVTSSFCGDTGSGYLATLVPGAEHDEVQRLGAPTDSNGIESTTNGDVNRKRPRVVVVAFVGGVTHAEVSALRTLASASDANVEFVFITTGFLNAKSYLSSLSQRIEPGELLPF